MKKHNLNTLCSTYKFWHNMWVLDHKKTDLSCKPVIYNTQLGLSITKKKKKMFPTMPPCLHSNIHTQHYVKILQHSNIIKNILHQKRISKRNIHFVINHNCPIWYISILTNNIYNMTTSWLFIHIFIFWFCVIWLYHVTM